MNVSADDTGRRLARQVALEYPDLDSNSLDEFGVVMEGGMLSHPNVGRGRPIPGGFALTHSRLLFAPLKDADILPMWFTPLQNISSVKSKGGLTWKRLELKVTWPSDSWKPAREMQSSIIEVHSKKSFVKALEERDRKNAPLWNPERWSITPGTEFNDPRCFACDENPQGFVFCASCGVPLSWPARFDPFVDAAQRAKEFLPAAALDGKRVPQFRVMADLAEIAGRSWRQGDSTSLSRCEKLLDDLEVGVHRPSSEYGKLGPVADSAVDATWQSLVEIPSLIFATPAPEDVKPNKPVPQAPSVGKPLDSETQKACAFLSEQLERAIQENASSDLQTAFEIGRHRLRKGVFTAGGVRRMQTTLDLTSKIESTSTEAVAGWMQGAERLTVLQTITNAQGSQSTTNYVADLQLEYWTKTVLDSLELTDPEGSPVDKDVQVLVHETLSCHTELIERAILTQDKKLLAASEYILRLGVDFAQDWLVEATTRAA